MRKNIFITLLCLGVLTIYSCNNGDYNATPGIDPALSNPLNKSNANTFLTATINGQSFIAYTRKVSGLDSIPIIYASDGKTSITLMILDKFTYKPAIFPIDSAHLNRGFYQVAGDSTIHIAKSGQINVTDADSFILFKGNFSFVTTDSITVIGGFNLNH